MRLVKVLNNYFFDEDTIILSDALYFYGILAIIIIVGITSISI